MWRWEQKAFSEAETNKILSVLPLRVFIINNTVQQDDIKLLSKLFYTFYNQLDNFDLKEMPENWMLDKIKNPMLGFFWISLKDNVKKDFLLLHKDKGFIFPFSNLGELHTSLTFAKSQFSILMKQMYPESEWLDCNGWKGYYKHLKSIRNLHMPIKHVFVNKYRCDWYATKIKQTIIPEKKRHWSHNIDMAKLAIQEWDFGIQMWGLTLKGADILLPDYKAFL